MPAFTCPQCAARLELPATQHPYLTCPRCLGVIWNVGEDDARPAGRRTVDREVNGDRLGSKAGLVVLAVLATGGLLFLGSDTTQWIVYAAILGWALALAPRPREREPGGVEKILRAGLAVLGVALLLALAVFLYLFIQCLEVTRGMG